MEAFNLAKIIAVSYNEKKINKRKLMKIGVASCLLIFTLTMLFIFTEDDYKAETIYINEELLILNIEESNDVKKEANISFLLDLEKVKNIKNLMIVAHPDDETFWAGDFISKEKSLVLCLTNGGNAVRKKEFLDIMRETNNYGIILEYPDNPNQIKDNWSEVKDSIYNDLHYLVSLKSWNKVITHNPEGEYGHLQHKFTSMIVTNICVEAKKLDNLYYFEKYMTREKVKEEIVLLTEKEIAEKSRLMQMYSSQDYSYQAFKHMIGYEKLIAYNDWYFD